MKSKASIDGHPIHTILVSFPIAFFAGTFICDIVFLFTGKLYLWHIGKAVNLAGIIMALAAAVPGFIDYLFTVPPASSAKSRAAKHGLLNVSVLILYTIAILMKQYGSQRALIISLEAIGVLLLGIAGFMGGTLVYRNQIGVYNRYADKGTWRELYARKSAGRIEVAFSDELKKDQMKLVHTHNKRIVIARTEEGYVAFSDRCTHKGGSLAGGVMICGTVQCPWHGSQFAVSTGAVKAGPASEKLAIYKVEEANGKIYLLYNLIKRTIWKKI